MVAVGKSPVKLHRTLRCFSLLSLHHDDDPRNLLMRGATSSEFLAVPTSNAPFNSRVRAILAPACILTLMATSGLWGIFQLVMDSFKLYLDACKMIIFLSSRQTRKTHRGGNRCG